MEKYLGVKLVEAEPKNLGDYNKFKGWNIPKDEDPLREGYMVKYSDNYISWSPKEIFEEAYRKLDKLTFGLAIEALKEGKCIRRNNWNGKGMFVSKQVPGEVCISFIHNMQSVPQGAKAQFINKNLNLQYSNQMVIVKPDNTIDSWVPSASDVFAEDWIILE